MEIALENRNGSINERELAFLCAAITKQMREHFAPNWQEEPWVIKPYKRLEGLSVGSFWPVSILPDLGHPGSSDWAHWEPGLAYGCLRWNPRGPQPISVEASHICLELRMDPRCMRWVHIGEGCFGAVEICDPVEADTYEIEVTAFGEKKAVPVSDFLLPSYFVRGAKRPYSFLDRVDSTIHERGLSRQGKGYLIVRLPHGEVIEWWGHRAFGLVNRKAPPAWRKGEDYLSRIFKRKMGVIGEIANFSDKLVEDM